LQEPSLPELFLSKAIAREVETAGDAEAINDALPAFK